MKDPNSQRAYRFEADGVRIAEIISVFVSDDWQAWKYPGDRCERRRGMIKHLSRGSKKIRPSDDAIAAIRNRGCDDIAITIPGDHCNVFVLEHGRQENSIFYRIAGCPAPRHFPAVHMTFGAINEISTLTGYQALISRTDFAHDRFDSQRPLLTTILERIIKDERRHLAFYFNQARRRLRVPAARRLTALLVRNFRTPVGVTVRGDPAMRRVCAYLFPGKRGVERLGAVDKSIARLPGLEWFDLGARYARRVQASGPRICFPAQARSSG